MKRLAVVTGIVSLLGVSMGIAAADTSAPTMPAGGGEQVCLVLSHDASGHGTDDFCVDL